MSRKVTKLLSILLVVAMLVGIAATPVFASVTINWSDPNIKIEGNVSDTSAPAKAAKDISGTIIGVVQVIGVAVAVIMLIVLAIKYISAAPNDKAEIKKHAVVYVVGAVVLFAASGILEIIKGFAAQVNA